MAEITHWYLHVDLDAFFASVEQLDNPSLKGKPVIIGGKPEDRRSVVSTASYEARRFGVHSAMPVFQAYKLCPNGIFIHPRMQRYSELSFKIMNIFKNYSPDVDQMSIDEAFIDLTGTEKLFGPVEETAKKIKADVKNQTGLTVSVGLATTKYLAKIASGFSKPDGFYQIKEGQEENFMIVLPLNKVWGLGPKSLELIKSKGYKTTKELHQAPLETLKFLFGNNMALFLYDVVRGKEKESFTRKTKSHSISAEKTFPYDLTDIYAIETELLELSQSVFFRLLKEESYSKTAFVKIRYTDFSTCTVQETFDRNFLTIDSYFEIIKRLFEKKYENGRGIRLLGLGFENVEKEKPVYQQELFENKDEKKQAVEKAILSLQKKHPEIKINKARTLKTLLFLLSLFFVSPNKSFTEDYSVTQKGAATSSPDTFYTPEEKPEKESGSLFNWEINDKNKVNFSLNGYWQTELSQNITANFGQSLPLTFSFSTPVFKQEIELSSQVLLNQNWFFQADFAQEFTKNTFSVGYKSGNFLRLLKLSNRDISFENQYSALAFGYSLNGGNNQSPGILSHLQSSDNKLKMDFLLRYDMTESHSATFYGSNKVDDVNISIESFLYGFAYNFPDEADSLLNQIDDIYVESKTGNFRDSNGRLYKKLSKTDYLYQSSNRTLYFSYNAKAFRQDDFIPNVLLTFNSSGAVNQIINLSGTYSDSASFFGKIQETFNQTDSKKKYNLKDYTNGLSTVIENKAALVIQSSTGFSPYLCANNYEAGYFTNADLSVINKSTELTLNDFSAEENNSDFVSLHEDFFKDKVLYAKVTSKNNSGSYYPFAKEAPEIYLNLPNNSDISILVRSYTPVSEFQIGTEASAATVTVYKNNVIDTSAIYNPQTGTVILSSTPSTTDKIYIVWQEDSKDYSQGSIAGAAGLKYHFTPNLTSDILLSGTWPLSYNATYSTPDDIKRGFLALTTGLEYKGENYLLSNKTAISLQKDNAASMLKVSSQEDLRPETYYLEYQAGYSTKAQPVLNTDSTQIFLDAKDNCTINDHYGIKDSNITGYKIPLSWDFSQNESGWASVDIHLSGGNLLKKSDKLNISLLPEFSGDFTTESYEVYLQLGVKADSTFYGEDSANIPCWKLDSLDLSNDSWQTVTIYLDDTDKARLVSDYDARLIIKTSSSYTANENSTKGCIYFGPYEPVIQTVTCYHDENIITSTSSLSNGNDNYTSVINWHIPSAIIDSTLSQIEDTNINSISYFTAADFSTYKSIEFKFAVNVYEKQLLSSINDENGFILILDNKVSDFSSDGETALKVQLKDLTTLFDQNMTYHTLKVNLETNKVFIDDQELDSESYDLFVNKNVVPSRQKIIINTQQADSIYTKGTFYLNDLTFSENQSYLILQNQITASYKRDGSIIKVQNFDLVKDFYIKADSRQSLSNFVNPNFSIISNGESQINLAGMQIKADFAHENTQITSSGHYIKSSDPIFKVLSLEENYRFNQNDSSLKKEDNFNLDFSSLNIPLNLGFKANASDEYGIRKQNVNLDGNLQLNFKNNYAFTWKNTFTANQKINSVKNNLTEFNYDNYFSAWHDISTLEYSEGHSEASERKTKFESNMAFNFPFANFKPNLTYSTGADYSNTQSGLFTDKSNIILNTPFKISKNSFNFKIDRSAGSTSFIQNGGNYFSDTKANFYLLDERKYLFTSIPFYELFDKNLTEKVSAKYAAKYEINFKKPLTNSLKDLYIPSSASFAVIRNIDSQEKYSDLYQLKTVITNTSLNNLGSNSKNKLFTFFKQEEIISNFTGIAKIPVDRPENASYQAAGYLQVLFFISDKASLSTAFDASISTDLDWSLHSTILYRRPGHSSLLTESIKLLFPNVNTQTFSLDRKDSLNIEISQSNFIKSQNYSYVHSLDFKFLKYFTITNSFGGEFNHKEDSVSSLSLNLSIGCKAEF